MSFQITGPGLYRTRGGRKAVVEREAAEGKYPWIGFVGATLASWVDSGKQWDKESDNDLVAPWGESEAMAEVSPSDAFSQASELALLKADLDRLKQQATTPYHRTEQFRAETARMLFAARVGQLGCGPEVDACIKGADALIAALDRKHDERIVETGQIDEKLYHVHKWVHEHQTKPQPNTL